MIHIDELVGSQAEGALQMDQRSINQLLALTSKTTAPVLELFDHNQVLIRYGVVHARAELIGAADVSSSPAIRLRLASTVVAIALKNFVRQPFLHIDGREVTITLAAIPALEPWRRELRHLKRLEFSTSRAVLRLQFVAAITE